ncbi:hydantoinase/oxoprolinase family protein [Salipaludibacillus sp. CF4.18]|uniref:hydantoinase/oxoprolinase family protein n=1 Tax=Salipaludibacillus sp. CF4.18 TaxID=3373081 RepID=UPI003EE79651
MNTEKYRLGIDIGGTFTDLVLLNEASGDVISLKTPTVVEHPTQGIANGLQILRERGIDPSTIHYFVHGTTIGLNTIIQRNGANLALFVTEGFRDLFTLQRLRLPIPYDFRSRHPEAFIPRKSVFPIRERLTFDGSVHQELDMESLDTAIEKAHDAGVDGIVICFLHSYVNPSHEQLAAERIKERYPNMEVNMSSELWPQMREFERAVMTSMNLYIHPKVSEHFHSLEKRLKTEGVAAKPLITQSNGGIMDVKTAIEQPVKTLFSGPAAGIIGALQVAESAGIENVMTFDVGGTSADISIIHEARPTYTSANQLGGFPVMLPAVSMFSIGAGGGSYAWIDNGGLLKVGPDSVGSEPGPACYGIGNKAALTDAFLLCGYLNQRRYAGGGVALHVDRSDEALSPIANHLQLDVKEAADRMIRVAIANMYAEMSTIMEHQGFDPREFTLLSFGGAGPVMANYLAEEIQAKNVLVPPLPGTLSALGAMTADFIHDEMKTRHALLHDIPMDSLRNDFSVLVDQAKSWLENQERTDITKTELNLSIDARYRNQAFEIELPIQSDWLETDTHEQIVQSFHRLHQTQYGHQDPEAFLEIINLRVRIVGYTPKPSLQTLSRTKKSPEPVEYRTLVIYGKRVTAPIYERSTFLAGDIVQGPAVIEQDDTTVLVLDGWESKTDQHSNLILQRVKGGDGK